MPSAYCPSGHRVSYEATKPAKCPVCSNSMEIRASELPVQPVSTASAPRGSQPRQYEDAYDPALEKWEGIQLVRDPEDAKLPTVEDVRKGNVTFARTDDNRRAPDGKNTVVRAADLVNEILKNGPAPSQTATAAKKPVKRARQPRAKKQGAS